MDCKEFAQRKIKFYKELQALKEDIEMYELCKAFAAMSISEDLRKNSLDITNLKKKLCALNKIIL